MLVHSYKEMLEVYNIKDLPPDDNEERIKMLSAYTRSVIFEGSFLEYDNAEKWVKENIDDSPVNFLFYGKLGYDYGFFEISFKEESHAKKLSQVIPTLFTTFPNGKTEKTAGMDNFIELREKA